MKKPEFLTINPFGLIPAINHDGLTVFESGAIVSYLAGLSGKLMPESEREQTKALQWVFTATATIEPPMTQIAVIDLFEADADWAQSRRPALVASTRNKLEVLEGLFTDSPYLLGRAFTYPDILMTSVLDIIQHTDILNSFPNLTAYRARCQERSAWRRCREAYGLRLNE